MRIILFVEDEAVIKKILSHLDLWLPQYHDPPDYPDYPGSPDYEDNNLSPVTSSGASHDAEISGNLQLDIFSGRSVEWWEAGNSTNQRNANPSFNSDCEYQSPYEDEFSQEVFYNE